MSRVTPALPLSGGITGEMESHICTPEIQRKLLSLQTRPSSGAPSGVGEAYSGGLPAYHFVFGTYSDNAPYSARRDDCREFMTLNGSSFAVSACCAGARGEPTSRAKLPLLATYGGHVFHGVRHFIACWIEPLRTAAGERFARHYGELVVSARPKKRAPMEKLPNLLRCYNARTTAAPTIYPIFARMKVVTPSRVTATALSCSCGFSLGAPESAHLAELDLTDLDPPSVLAFLSLPRAGAQKYDSGDTKRPAHGHSCPCFVS